MSGKHRLRSAIAGAALMTAAGGAMAVPVETNLNYHCYYEIIGWQPMSVNIQSDMPAELPAGTLSPQFDIEATATVKGQTWVGLASILRATSLEGHAGKGALAPSHVGGPNFDFPLFVDMEIPNNAIPSSDPGPDGFDLAGINGFTPPIMFREENVGTMVIRVMDTENDEGGYTFEELDGVLPENIAEEDLGLKVVARRDGGEIIVQPPITDSEGVIHSKCVLEPGQEDAVVLHTFEVTGDVVDPVPKISVSPDEVDFGNVQSGLTATESVSVSNAGGAALGINQVVLDGDPAFTQINDCSTVGQGASCTVDITYNASGDETHSTTLTIASTDPENPEVTVAISGTSETAATPDLSVDPESLSFGKVAPGMPSTKSVTVNNDGTAPMTVTGVSVGGEHASEFFQANDCTTVAPEGSCSVDVTFTPADTGNRSATLTLDSDGGSAQVPLSGEGFLDNGGGVEIAMDLVGTSFINRANGPVALSGGIDVNVDLSTGLYTADLNLEPTSGEFNILYMGRFVDSIADVTFEQVGQTTGQWNTSTHHLSSDSEMYVGLPKISLRIFGFAIPIGGGAECRTAEPAQIHLESPEGEQFDPLGDGGRLQGTYTLPEVENCGMLTGFINIFMAGPGNTIEMDLTPNL